MKNGSLKTLKRLLLAFLLITCCSFTYAQKKDSLVSQSDTRISNKSLRKVAARYELLNKQMSKRSLKLLNSFEKYESELKNRLSKNDPIKARQLFSENTGYEKVASSINAPLDSLKPIGSLNNYIPGLDTLNTAAKILVRNSLSKTASSPLNAVSSNATSVQYQLQMSENIHIFLKQRQQFIREQFGNVSKLNELKGINKELFYYQQSVQQYKDILKDRAKIEKQLISIAKRSPLFQQTIQGNTWLAALFPGSSEQQASELALPGSQTIEYVDEQLSQTYGGLAGDPQQYMIQQVPDIQAEVSSWQSKLNPSGLLPLLPDTTGRSFIPNQERGKALVRRIEFGFDMQSQKSSHLLPISTDFGIHGGYRFSQNFVVGLGISYKVGWGNSLNKIKITSEGMGLRSYTDVRLVKSIWLTGAWEYNYWQRFSDLHDLKNLDAWQKSALAGVTKKIQVGKRTASIRILYDFLHKSHIPYTQSFFFRFGYNYK